MHKKISFVLFTLLLGLLLSVSLVAALSAGRPTLAAPGALDEALIAIQFGPGDQIVRKVGFTAPISGLQALQNSGLPVETVDFGGGFIAVCSINGVGCPAADCFCDPNRFWNYEYWDGSAWQGYLTGAASTFIGDGAIEGWRWAEWGVGSLPPAPQLQAAQAALDWLASKQDPVSGGYGSASNSVETLLSIAANSLSASTWITDSSPSLFAYIEGVAAGYAAGGDAAGKLAVGLSGANESWPVGASQPLDFYNPVTGAFTGVYSDGGGPQSWSILGTVGLEQNLPDAAIAHLISLQQPGGGWEWTPGGFGTGADTNTTALAIQALIAAGECPHSSSIVSGLDFLKQSQNTDGGFPYDADSPYGTDSDANSTAYVIQAILSTGEDPSAWTINNTNPISYLLSLQLPDGSFEFQPGSGTNLFSTQQAIPALLERSFPFNGVLTQCPVLYLPLVGRASN